MKKTKDIYSLFYKILILSVFLCVVGCGDTSKKIRIGINAWPGYEILHLAQVKGYFNQVGVTVDLVEFNSLSDAARSYELGQIDGLATTAVEVLMARANTKNDLKIVRILDFSNGADMIVAPKEIPNMNALRGKPVGVELASLGTFVLGRALDEHKMSFSDIKIVSEDQLTMEERLKNGEISAVVTYPPVAIKLIEDEKYHPIFTSAEIPGEVVDVLAMDGALVNNNKKSIDAINRALDLAYAYMESNRDDAIRIMAEREAITPEQFTAALNEGIELTTPEDSKALMAKGGKLQNVINLTARYLEQIEAIKPKPDLTDCIE